MSEPEVSKSLQKLWPPGTFGKDGHQQAPGQRTVVQDAPKTPAGGKRPAARVTKPKPAAKKPKVKKSVPGGQTQKPRSKPQQGR